MSDQREAVRSNAKYLRSVRPIDPEEICSYVEGTPHPAVVRQLLREEAVDLGLVERDNGTFVPVEDEPVTPRRGPVERFPADDEQRVEALLADRYGPQWATGASGDLLRSTIRRFKANYLSGAPVQYDQDVAAGYAIYHLPPYYAAVQYALDDLAEQGLLTRDLRVLDVGAGVGGPALGLIEYLGADALLDYHAIEPSAAAGVLEQLLAKAGRNVHWTIHESTVEDFDTAQVATEGFDPTAVDDGFDLVLACNVLSELAEPDAVGRSLLELLAPDGTLLAMAPADKNTSIQLRAIERALEDERLWDDTGDADRVTVFGPTVRCWPDERPTDRGWSFDARPDLAVPSFQRQLEDATPSSDDGHTAGEFVNVDVQFSYSLLRRDGRRELEVALESEDWARMADMDRHVTNRIDLVAAKLSRSLSEGDANPLFKISDGSEAVEHYAVLTKETGLNRDLLAADYGDLLAFERVLALWNDDEGAYNLVVDDETVVDRLA